MRKSSCQAVSGFVVFALVASGCFGPFNLTRRLYHWNAEVGDQWEREIVFLLLALTPVYGLATVADAVVFNSMEFWTGKNPVDPQMMRKGALPHTTRFALGSREVRMTRLDAPSSYRSMVLEFFDHGQPSGVLRFEHTSGHPTVARDAQDRVLMSATTLPSGDVLLQNGHGQQIAVYHSDQLQQVAQYHR